MLELKMGQRGITLLVFVGFCGEFPMAGLKMFGGYYDYNRRLVTQLVREGYLKERKIAGYDRRVVRSLSLTAKGLEKLRKESLPMAQMIERHPIAPPDGQGDRWKTLRLHRSAYCLLSAARIGAYWLPSKGKLGQSEMRPVYYGAYELNKMYEKDNKGARASGVLIDKDRMFILYYLGEHNMRWVEESEKMFQNQVTFSPPGKDRKIVGNIYIGEDWALAKSILESACKPYSRMIRLQRGITHNYVTTDGNGLRLLRTIVYPGDQLKLERRIFEYGIREQSRLTLQFDLEELMEYYRPHSETGYNAFPDCGYFFDFQMDAVELFCTTETKLVRIPGKLLHEK